MVIHEHSKFRFDPCFYVISKGDWIDGRNLKNQGDSWKFQTSIRSFVRIVFKFAMNRGCLEYKFVSFVWFLENHVTHTSRKLTRSRQFSYILYAYTIYTNIIQTCNIQLSLILYILILAEWPLAWSRTVTPTVDSLPVLLDQWQPLSLLLSLKFSNFKLLLLLLLLLHP